jgi:hypothetical protein
MITKVKTIDDVFEIIDNQWSEYIKMRSDAIKYTKCGFDNYIWYNRELAEWRDANVFEDYWENKDYWIKRYTKNPTLFTKDIKQAFTNYFDEMYYSYLENN